MRRLLLLCLFLPFVASSAEAEVHRAKNTVTRLEACFYNSSTGALIGGATGVDCEYSQYSDGVDPATFADFTNAEAEIATNSGCFKVTTTAGEMNADYVKVKCTSTSTNATPVTYTVNTTIADRVKRMADARGTAQAATSTTLQLAASETFADDELNCNTSAYIVSASAGAGQTACITDYVGATDTATLTWVTTPTGTITYDLLSTPNCCSSGGGAADWNANEKAQIKMFTGADGASGTPNPTAYGLRCYERRQ